ncbi:MAG: nodulation protein NodH, partial [Pseudomonadota bacterium]
MHTPFEYFVVFAEMRTGSNMFQEALNSFPGITCYGELFNPHFVEGPVRKSSFDISLADRDADPLGLLGNMRSGAQDTLPGFRFFHDHDPRVFEHCVADPTCAKIVLTRAPLDAYISLKIAQATGQWRLSDISDRKDAKAHFDAGEYAVFLEDRSNFAARLEAGLQVNGQAAFRLTYGDLGDVSKLNGV